MSIEKIEINGHYVWVDKDAVIKEGDYVLSKLFEIVKFGEKYTPSLYKKIIASSPELNLEGVPTYVEWLADNSYEGCDGCDNNDEMFYKNGFIKGHQTAEKELPTWDDVRKAISMARETEYGLIKSKDEIIEQLKQDKK